MAENRDDNLLNQRLAHFRQQAKSLLMRRSIDPAVVARVLEVMKEMEKSIAERDGYRSEGSDDLAKVMDEKIKRGEKYVADTLDEYGADKPPEDTGGDQGGGEDVGEDTGDGSNQSEPNENQGQDDSRRPDKKDFDRKLDRKTPEKPGSKAAKSTTKPAPKPAVKPPVPAAGGAAGAGGKIGGKQLLMTVAKSPYFWLVVAIILVILVIVMWFFGKGHKTFNEAGGSIPIPMNFNNEEHVLLAGQVMQLKNNGMLVFSSGTEGDIVWAGETMNLDWRVMETLKYLGNVWAERSYGIIEISTSYSNGPAVTRRKGVLKTFGVVIGGEGDEPLDAPSAYLTGQAIGITKIGRVSNGLAEACFNDFDGDPRNNAAVQVRWQEVVLENEIRPIYEQLQVDGALVYQGAKVLAGIARRANEDAEYKQKMEELLQSGGEDDWYAKVGKSLDYMIENLSRMRTLQNEATDSRTIAYASRALTALGAVRGATKGDVLAWEDADIKTQLERGISDSFRMMQVANMVGWNGSTAENCRLWKAYEARQNIRRLVLDIEQMPADPTLVPANKNWNEDMMARQVIIYSPEDDLDNGWPEYDVYPKGAKAVDEGGVGFDDTGKDGVITIADSHFSDLPVDGGIFSKASTIFVYKAKGAWDLFQTVSSEMSLGVVSGGSSQVLDQMHDLFSGTGTSSYSGEDLKKVTYKNFVHIGF